MNTEMGQILGAIPNGVHRFLGQTKSQLFKSAMRGIEWNQLGGLWTTMVARNHHQSGGGGLHIC